MCESFTESIQQLMQKLEKQSPEEGLKLLIKAGILDADLELNDAYCSRKQLRDKRKRRKLKEKHA